MLLEMLKMLKALYGILTSNFVRKDGLMWRWIQAQVHLLRSKVVQIIQIAMLDIIWKQMDQNLFLMNDDFLYRHLLL